MNKTSTSDTALEIGLFTSGDEEGLLRFYRLNSKTWERFAKLWEWRKGGLQYSGGEVPVITKENGEIVGSVGIVPAALTTGGKRIRASWQQDSLVSQAMRGRGLGKKLVNEGAKGWELAMAKGTSDAMYNLRKSMGFIDVQNSNYLVKVIGIRNISRDLKYRMKEYGLYFLKVIFPIPGRDRTIEIKTIEEFDKSFDVLADKLSKENILRPYKDQGYLNWRYFRCPDKKYQVYRAGGEQALGATVLNVTGPYNDEGWIVDMVCTPGNNECAYSLLHVAMKYFEKQNVSRVYSFATLPTARKWLYRFGFLPTKMTPRFTYRIQDKNLGPKTICNAPWDFWHGDGDVELYN